MNLKVEKLQKKYLDSINRNDIPLPRIIHVETRSRCNGTCAFCPASVAYDKREDIYMPFELIEKVIYELSEVGYFNRLSFYNNNEPYLDDRIYKIIKFAREILPKAYLELKSNGRNLTTKKILDIFNAGLDMLYINDYSADKRYHKNVQKIVEDLASIRRFKGHMQGVQYYSRIKVSLCDENAVLKNRAGNSPNKSLMERCLKASCFRPMEMMTINPEGNVSVCSEDFYYSINMGNVNESPLFNIWTSERWNTIRKRLLLGERDSEEACSRCDYRGVTYEMLNENNLLKRWVPEIKVKSMMRKLWGKSFG